ncbi:hypothetical protein K1719_027465 [Acacia pycnantha]|nr:hypothetical protein K1719_027465 [Acacia pycnantha]
MGKSLIPILMYLNAGHESSAHTTMWATVYLHQHAEIFQRAKAEQEEIIRERPPTQTGLTMQEIRQMEYPSKACIIIQPHTATLFLKDGEPLLGSGLYIMILRYIQIPWNSILPDGIILSQNLLSLCRLEQEVGCVQERNFQSWKLLCFSITSFSTTSLNDFESKESCDIPSTSTYKLVDNYVARIHKVSKA